MRPTCDCCNCWSTHHLQQIANVYNVAFCCCGYTMPNGMNVWYFLLFPCPRTHEGLHFNKYTVGRPNSIPALSEASRKMTAASIKDFMRCVSVYRSRSARADATQSSQSLSLIHI